MLDPNKKKIPQVQGQRRNCNKMVGGMKLCIEANPIPFRLVGGLKKKKKNPCVHQDPETAQETEPDLTLNVS